MTNKTANAIETANNVVASMEVTQVALSTANAELALKLEAFKAMHKAEEKAKSMNVADLFSTSDRKAEIVKGCIYARFELASLKPLNHFDLQWCAIAKPKNGKTNAEFWSQELMLENLELITLLAIESVKAKGMKSSFIPWIRAYNKSVQGTTSAENAL
jgi:hypothetical protein